MNDVLDYALVIAVTTIILGGGVWVMVLAYRKTFGDDDAE